MRHKPNHIMIDLETMSTDNNAAIVSIGAVVFDPRYNVVTDKTFYTEFNWSDQDFEYNRDISDDTIEWWEKQPEKTRNALNGSTDLTVGLVEFIDWVKSHCPDDAKVWANGPTFDIIILDSAFAEIGLKAPWRFWNVRCCRTIRDMFNATRGGLQRGSGALSHHALEDSQLQAAEVNKCWTVLCKT